MKLKTMLSLLMQSVLLLALIGYLDSPAFGNSEISSLGPLQTESSYEAAVHYGGNFYVKITLIDASTESTKTICTTANVLIDAILKAHSLSKYKEQDVAKAVSIALANKEHAFRFKTRDAFDMFPIEYSAADLSAARALLAPFSIEQIKHKFSSVHYSPSGAIACAAIERGLSAGIVDMTGEISIGP